MAVADYLSTLRTPALQTVMRDTPTRPLEALINHHGVTIDYASRRIWRDCFWKGSFARDTVMGWEERLATPIRPGSAPFAGGRFWKRFDGIRDGAASAFIVNYGIRLLPGRAEVRQVQYPDGKRRYVAAGDDILLLTYQNQPYRIVYDLIKVVDENHCVGVMHLGTFPNGREFATFVMARNNYPFHKMCVPDHDAIFASDHARAPSPEMLRGTWSGHLIFHRHPELALHNQFNPSLLRVRFDGNGPAIESRVRVGPLWFRKTVRANADGVELTGSGSSVHEIRSLDADTLISRVVRPGRSSPGRRYILTRSQGTASHPHG